jgi:hypothetical protein
MSAANPIPMYAVNEDPKEVIPGGYFIKARKIKDSDIAHCAPVVREVWDWLLMECNHKPGNGINRGQCVRRLVDIQEGLHWYVGYRKMMYSKTQCESALNTLRKMLMITTTKTTRGMLITVCNYDTYQNPKNYEDNNEDNKKTTRRQQPSDTINKNDKNDKNVIDADWRKTHKGFFLKQYDANGQEPLAGEYLELIEFLHGNNKHEIFFSNVLSLEKQISYRDFVSLKETASKSSRTIGQVLVSMENTAKLKTKYKNVFLTANNWLKNDFEKK